MTKSVVVLCAVVSVFVLLGIFVNGWRLGDQSACHRVVQALTVSQRLEAAAYVESRACAESRFRE